MTRKILRGLCLVTALANAGGNVALLLLYRPIFSFLGVPLPGDLYSFTCVSAFSFTMGVLAYLVFRAPERGSSLLVVGSLGKGAYALVTLYFYFTAHIHWFYLVFGVWDAAFSVIFLLFLIHLASNDISRLNAGEITFGGTAPSSRRALLLYFSLTGNGARALAHVRMGLERKGYSVDEKAIESAEPLFHFPFSFVEFVRIMLRAIFRRPASIRPLGIEATHPYDLIIVEGQTWFVGMGAIVEAVFQSPEAARIFAGRDVATVNVCRGLWRRSQAMTVRWLEASGANVVGARHYANPGWEPARTLSLFVFLAVGKPFVPKWLGGFLQPQQLADAALVDLERFGERLAERPLGKVAVQ